VILGLVAIACGAALVAYRHSTQPTTLTVATGSLDGDAPKLMQAIASRLNATNAPVRLKVVDKMTALDAAKAFSSGETDLAVVRADVGVSRPSGRGKQGLNAHGICAWRACAQRTGGACGPCGSA